MIDPDEIAELEALASMDDGDLLDDSPEMGDEAKATALLGVLGEVQRELADVESLYEHYEEELHRKLAKLAERKAERLVPLVNRMAGLERWLDGWHRAQVTYDKRGRPQRLTIHLPTGTLKLSHQPPEVTIDDQAAFMAWAEKEAPDLIVRPMPSSPPPRPDKTKVNTLAKFKLAEQNPDNEEGAGYLLPGVLVVVRDRKFTATPDI